MREHDKPAGAPRDPQVAGQSDTDGTNVDVAALGILQERAVVEAARRSEQLQRALNTRVLIEQAKGVMAERHDMAPRAAVELLRCYARSNNRKLRDICHELIEGRLEL